MYKLLVSEPSMTNFESFSRLAEEVWKSKYLTNNGPKVQELERRLKEKWSIPHLSLVLNGTIALELSIRALNLPEGSKIITTPFTWISTVSSIHWNKYTPVFVDIDPMTLNIDVDKIEEAITDDVSAILAVHVFSNPCDVERIEEISKKHNLRVIYDGAHSVNVNYKGRDLSAWGDITIHSYHATKIYNCGEAGSIITQDDEIAERIERLRVFGMNSAKDVVHEGTNAKIHEITACIGLANLEMMDRSIEYRRLIAIFYKDRLKGLPIKYQAIDKYSYNFSYFPMIFETEEQCLKVYYELERNGILTRRYFYPSINQIEFYQGESCPVSEDISRRILCLPCHDRVTQHDVDDITKIIKSTFRKKR
jgi:dTDP-4-amino-4,6-dideoxygalactose transaminase